MRGVKVIIDNLAKEIDAAPGWVPLLLICSVFAESSGWDFSLPMVPGEIPAELYALLLTYLFYQIGHALDDFVFKTKASDYEKTDPFYVRQYESDLRCAQSALRTCDGVYATAMQIATAAREKCHKQYIRIRVYNETAKFLRSLLVPGELAAIWFYLAGQPLAAIASIVIAVIAFCSYPELKVNHIRRLYRLLVQLTTTERYEWRNLDGIRLQFWENKLVASTRIDSSLPECL